MKIEKLRSPLGIMALAAVFVLSTLYVSAHAGKRYKSLRDSKAWLGIYMQDIDEELAEAFDIQTEEGVLIDGVVDDSPADNAGLRSGDIVVELDSVKILDSGDLSRVIRRHDPGDEVEIKILRKGREKMYTVELGRENKYNQALAFYDGAVKLYGDPRHSAKSIYIDGDGGYLGVSTIELSDQLAEYFGTKFGVLVTEVEEDSPAEEVGIQAGDIITAVNNEDVFTPSELGEIIRDYDEGDEVAVRIARREKELIVTATLDEASGVQWHGGFDHRFFNVPSIPSLPSLPSMPSLPQFDNLRMLYDLDADEFEEYEEEMDELREELRELQEELEIIKEKLD